MVVRKRKKSRHYRGRKTGRGRGKRSRGAGSRGGRGRAGFGKRAGHRKMMPLRYKELRIPGKRGFKSVKQRFRLKGASINIGELERVLPSLLETGAAVKKDVGIEINLESIGYKKLLSKGRTEKKLLIKVRSCTEAAKKKIEDVGGKVLSWS